MKSYFDIVLILFISLTFFISMMFFAEEIVVQQETVHLRNRVIEQLEINGGYTLEAKEEINKLIQESGRNIIVNVNKTGKLDFGEKILFEVALFYERKLPFDIDGKLVKYSLTGEYYNING